MTTRFITYLLVFGDEVREELGADLGVVAPLLQVNSVDLPCLNGLGDVGRVDLPNATSGPY